MLGHGEYQIIDGNKVDAMVKKDNWETAIGLSLIYGQKSSDYLRSLAKDSIEGRKTYAEVEAELKNYYSNGELADLETAKEYRCSLISAKIAEILANGGFRFGIIEFMGIHRYLFQGFLKDAGELRKNNALKESLEHEFQMEKEQNYIEMNDKERAEALSKFISAVWQLHPFEEGNTVVTVVFILKYLKSIGFELNTEPFKKNAPDFRNALIRANSEEKDSTHLESFIYKMLVVKETEDAKSLEEKLIEKARNKFYIEERTKINNRIRLVAYTDPTRIQIVLCLHIINLTARSLKKEGKAGYKNLYYLKQLAMEKLISEGFLEYQGIHLHIVDNRPHYMKHYTAYGYSFHIGVTAEEKETIPLSDIKGMIGTEPEEDYKEAFLIDYKDAERVIKYYIYGRYGKHLEKIKEELGSENEEGDKEL